jgi:hypothetical protein
MKSSADMCRARGWVVGDILIGTSCCGRTDAWLITAIGEELVVKRTVATLIDGEWIPQDGRECLGDLGFRAWESVRSLGTVLVAELLDVLEEQEDGAE